MEGDVFFNKNDYSILELIIVNECISPWRSLTTKYIIDNSNLSHVKVRQVLKTFTLLKYVNEGAKDGNKKTYYATKDGIDHYKQVFGYNDEDIEDLIINYQEELNNKGEI